MGAPVDQYLTGETASYEFLVVDINGDLVSGLTDAQFINKEVYSRSDYGAYVLESGQTFTVSGKGQPGLYEASYVIPAGFEEKVLTLVFREGTFAYSASIWHNYAFIVGPVEAPPLSGNDSWSSLYEVQSILGWATLNASTLPSESQVTLFLTRTATPVTALLRKAGLNYTVPSGDNPLTANSDVELMLSGLCGRANALEAAGHAAMAAEMRDQVGVPERAKGLFELASGARDALEAYLKTLPDTNWSHGTAVSESAAAPADAVAAVRWSTTTTEW